MNGLTNLRFGYILSVKYTLVFFFFFLVISV
jgi:hypothetical protein